VPDDNAVNDSPEAADELSAAFVDLTPVALRLYATAGASEAISRYRDILASRGIEWGLIGPREVDRLWSRHILNSAAIAELVPVDATLADVGSGAGLPGIPLALLRPDLRVTLIEPLLRRSNFLTHSVDDLGITGRVSVRRDRAEQIRQRYDVVASRALAPLDRLIRWCLPLMKKDGQILAIKGASAGREVDDHQQVISGSGLTADVVTVQAAPEVDPTTVIRLRLT
jgi:16S rRNA (guanine527-N7)-methyltransferase